MRHLLITIILTAFFLTYTKWYSLRIGLLNFIVALLSVYITFVLIIKVFEKIAEYFGISVDFQRIYLQYKYRTYSAISEKVYVFVSRIPIDIILLMLFGFATYGIFFPIFLSINFSPIVSKRVGRYRPGVNNVEKLKIIVYSIIGLWLIYTIIKSISGYAPILEAFTTYYYRTLMLFTISSVIPLSLLLTPVTKAMPKRRISGPSIGDILLANTTYNYITAVITLILLPLLSLYLNAILFLIVVWIVSSSIWLNERFKSVIKEI